MSLLVVVSDINGKFLRTAPDVAGISKTLENNFAVDRIDSIELAALSHAESQEVRHQRFLSGGIDVAAKNLIHHYPNGIQLAFGLSIGGVILWRAALNGLAIRKLVCFSSTRLRFETQIPLCETELYFGDADPYRPDVQWFRQFDQRPNFVHGCGHEFYLEDAGHHLFQRITAEFFQNH